MLIRSFFIAAIFFAFASPSMGKDRSSFPEFADVLVADGGQVILYYMTGNDHSGYTVVVRNCGDSFPTIIKRSDCVPHGPENKVQVDAFKQMLKQAILAGDPAKMKPFTPEEIMAFRVFDPHQLDQLKTLADSLATDKANLEKYIQQYGPDETAVARLAQVDKELTNVKAKLDLAKQNAVVARKVDDFLKGIINKQLSNTGKIFTVSSAKDGDQALFSMLKIFDASRGMCGTDDVMGGSARHTIAERVKNCAWVPDSTKKVHTPSGDFVWQMVSRSRSAQTGKFNEVWLDASTSLVWGDTLPQLYTHTDAIDVADDGTVNGQKACVSDDGSTANGRIGEKQFGLPTKEEFGQAQNNGLLSVLPDLSGRIFWTASLSPDKHHFATIFNGDSGLATDESGEDFRDNPNSVRCVGR